MIEILRIIVLMFTFSLPWYTGLVLIDLPILYVIGMIIASVFLARWFRKKLEEQENQKLEKLYLTSYISWILFFILLPVVGAIFYLIAPSSALLFIIPGIAFILFLTFLLIFNSKTKKTSAVEPIDD